MALKTCQFNKTNDCPVCPICEKENKPREGFLASQSSPARRALENTGIITVEKLASYTKTEILKLHGMGPSSLPKLASALSESGLDYRNEE